MKNRPTSPQVTKRIATFLVVGVLSGLVGCETKGEIRRAGGGAAAPLQRFNADPEWGEYRPYLQKMIDTIQAQWERKLVESRVYPKEGSSVKVVFRMNSKGAVTQIVVVEGTAGASGEKMCVSAITPRASHGSWSDEMKVVLGESQEMTFSFYYQ